ncbi:unnamed protein product [Macrosiphum euphorbiae]|uniref:Uncharacterized protein n=1 Tax=Macrosiphum euphorbiae TaxID=13131 RepID=A0AAV0VXA4_9HEMI|nr:unnamed protein product [Macrosiphum euphorbiae]
MPIQIDSNLGVTAAQITFGKQITIRNIYLPDSQDITTSGDSTNIIMKRLPSNFVSLYKETAMARARRRAEYCSDILPKLPEIDLQ